MCWRPSLRRSRTGRGCRLRLPQRFARCSGGAWKRIARAGSIPPWLHGWRSTDTLAAPAAQPVVDPERIQSPGIAAPPSDRASLRRRQRQWTLLAGVAAAAVLVAAGGLWRLWQQDYF